MRAQCPQSLLQPDYRGSWMVSPFKMIQWCSLKGQEGGEEGQRTGLGPGTGPSKELISL
jgi:hypothetical protein